MYGPRSAEFDAAVVAPHRSLRTRATVTGTAITDVAVSGGSVSVDAGRAVRRTCTATILDPLGSLVPDSGGDVLTPFGAELTLEAGFVLPSGTEYVPLGVFVLTEVKVDQAGAGARISVSGSDRSLRISRNRWLTPYTIAAGTRAVDAIADLLTDRWPDCPLAFGAMEETIGAAVVLEPGQDNDPWQDAVKIAADLGLDLAFDAAGRAVLRQVPDLSSDDPVATYTDGDTAMVTQISRGLTMEGRYNGVIVSGETVEGVTPVSAAAWDTDPTSPTWIDGPLGRVPRFYVSNLITTVAQAQATADAMLRNELGAAEAVSWAQVQNPAHDVYDVVQITRPEVGVDARYIIDALTVPLGAGPMTASARTRAVFG